MGRGGGYRPSAALRLPPRPGVVEYDNTPWVDVYWNDEIERHIAEHGLGYEDVENVLCRPIGEEVSQSSGRPIRFGYSRDGRKVAVVYEMLDEMTAYPITAYEVD